MQTLKPRSRKWKLPSRLAMIPLLLIPSILTACATDHPPPPVSTAPGQTNSALACTEFADITFNPGNPQATADSVTKIMAVHPDDPLAWARGELGDTMSTRAKLDAYMTARKSIGCN